MFADETGLRVPEGFEVTLYADDDLAHDVFSMTTDRLGRIVVSGPGYVRVLVDADRDGKADSKIDYSAFPKQGAQGMYFHGTDLLAIGDGGLWRVPDADGDGRADGEPQKYLTVRTGGEHHTHALRKGPDGYFYLLAGNDAGFGAQYINVPTSPILQPRAGVLMRFAPTLQAGEVLAHGFRNAYDFDFGPSRDLFVYDSDGERDVSMPWYRPTRVFAALPGTDAGWVTRSWKQPDHFGDQMPSVGDFGRGSPTGVVCYRHTHFPKEYAGNVFVLDWTFGRVIRLKLTPDGGGYRTESEEFITADGQFGFAPTDAVVGPDGAMYVSVGGRGTRGGVYRITATHPLAGEEPKWPDAYKADALKLCLTAPQPLASWSRAWWEPSARQVRPESFDRVATDPGYPIPARVRAIEILTEVYQGLGPASLQKIAQENEPDVIAAAIWSQGRTARQAPDVNFLGAALRSDVPTLQRAVLEAILGLPTSLMPLDWSSDLAGLLGSDDAWVRRAAIRAVRRLDEPLAGRVGEETQNVNALSILGFAHARLTPATPTYLDQYALSVGTSALKRGFPDHIKLDAVRLLQRTLGDLGGADGLADVFDGYSTPTDLTPHRAVLDSLRFVISEEARQADGLLHWELARLAAVLEIADPPLLDDLLKKVEPSEDPVRAMHYLIVTARMPGVRTSADRSRIADAFARMGASISDLELNRDRNWDGHFQDVYKAHRQLDPRLPASILRHPEFGSPEHVKFLTGLPEEMKREGVSVFIKRALAESSYEWNTDVVFVIGERPEHYDQLRKRFDDLSLRPAILMVLAKNPSEEDRDLFFEGLRSGQREVLQSSIEALSKLRVSESPDEWMKLLQAADRIEREIPDPQLLAQAVRLLDSWMGAAASIRPVPGSAAGTRLVLNQWKDWAVRTFPEAASVVAGEQADDLKAFRKVVAGLDWNSGDVARGKVVFEKLACAKCHNGSNALGPSLTGAAKRFSRDDLFTAIVAPNADVSSRYQGLLVVTTDGQVHDGLVVYESVDGVTLRTANLKTVRIEAADIEEKKRLTKSIMPSGLLKDAAPQQIADLYAYLKTL